MRPRAKSFSLDGSLGGDVWLVLYQQLEVLDALVQRETRTRFGEHRIGYLWALLEPILLIGTFWGLFALGNTSSPPGMTMVGFLATGFIPFQLFRECVARVSLAVSSNKALLFYPQVRPLDLMVARGFLEFSTYVTVLGIILGSEALYLGHVDIDEPLVLVLGLAGVAALGSSLGMVIASLSLFSPTVEKVAPWLLRPLFWLSAIFYSTNDLPSEFREVVLWNPIAHCIEAVRGAWFVGYASLHTSLVYPGVVLFGLVWLGVSLERISRARLEVS